MTPKAAAATALRRFIGTCFLLPAGSLQAQWVAETYPLKAGYNAIWLSIDCSDRTIPTLVPASVEEIWQWNADASSTHFDQQPLAPVQGDSQWKVWKKTGTPVDPTLASLTANAAYLVKVAPGTTAFNLSLKGKPVAPSYLLKSSGVNFFGFPTVPAPGPNFTNFLNFSQVLKNAPPIYYYNGETQANPRRLTNPSSPSSLIVRGQAYWVQTSDYSDYYGPLQITLLSGSGLDYGTKLTTATLRIRNVTDPVKAQTVTANLLLDNSATAPGQSTAAARAPLRLRGPRDANLQYTYTVLPPGGSPAVSVVLLPGEQKDLVLELNRTTLSTPGTGYASILRVSDSLGHTRIDLPVTATGTSRKGVWVGAAVLNAVNQVETLSGPESDAPIGTPNGATDEVKTVATTTKTTTGGLITQNNIADLSFDAADRAYLNAPGATVVSVAPWPSGPVDSKFNPGADSDVSAFAVQPDGKILVGGTFSILGGQARSNIGRLNASGTLDTAFNPGTDGYVRAFAVQPDGKILVSGGFTILAGQARSNIGRLNPDGTLDTSFTPIADGSIDVFALQSDGRILVGGYFSTLGGQARNSIGRFNANGTLDTTFNPGVDRYGAGLAVQPDGRILVFGYFSTLGGQARSNIGRLNANGTLDTTFNPGAIGLVGALAIQPDGRILVGGGGSGSSGFSILGGQARSNIGRLNADGTLDTTFNPGTDGAIGAFAVQPDGRILVGGDFSSLGGQARNNIGRGFLFTPGEAPLLPPATPVTDYTVVSTNRAFVTHGGSGYSAPVVAPATELAVTLVGGGGTGALATAQLSAGVAEGAVLAGGSGYTSAPAVTFSGTGSGAAGFAVIQDGLVTDVTVTNPGSGYASPPTVSFTGGSGTGAEATVKISGAVGSVTITAGGTGYTAAPTVVFTGGGGEGAEALATISGGVVTGVTAIQKGPVSVIADSARITYTTSTPAPAGTADGTVTSTSTSLSKVVTLNGKSHTVTRRVSMGGGAAAPSNFPVRLILHSPASGAPTLLQQAYLGSRAGAQFISVQEGGLAVPGSITALVKGGTSAPGNLGRVSSASFPRGQMWTGTGDFQTSASFTVVLDYNAESNPFVHTYHPDHDNWNALYEARLGNGQESYTVTRQITLSFDPVRPPGVSELTWGVTTLGGTYQEVISGLRAGEGISITGPFILQQVSEAATLTP